MGTDKEILWYPRVGNTATLQGVSLVKNPDSRFAVLSIHYTADPEKATDEWYAKTRPGYSDTRWRREYEISYELSGSLVFDKEAITWYMGQCKPPQTGYLILRLDRDLGEYVPQFKEGARGGLSCWKHPEKDKRYAIGVDVAEGLGEGLGDWSVATVIEYENMEEVAEFRGQVPPDVLAVHVCNLGHYYNNALIGIEKTGLGLAALISLRNGSDKHKTKPYWNVYYRLVLDDKTQRQTRKFGWSTDVQSKPVMIAYLEEVLRERLYKTQNIGFVSEARTYIDEDGDFHAQYGAHDDRVMATAIALQLRKQMPTHSVCNYSNLKQMGERGVGGENETTGY